MKKLFCILLRAAFIICLAACSSNKTEPVQPAEPAEQSQPEKEAVKFSRGTWNSDYTEFVNESTGLNIRPTSDFTVLSDEELVRNYMNGRDVDLSSWTDKDYEEQISIPETAFVNYYNGNNTGVLYENLAAEKALSISEDTYIKISTGKIKDTYTDMVLGDIYDLTLNGKSYRAIDIEYTANNTAISQTMACRKVGNYMTIIVFTVTNHDSAAMNEMIGFFG
ncbi:MAG: hypothetical protein IJG64_05415 [Oscillospiraceae bacterium]|nr:hypothetical protein [Oscillospiraceae bacterium]